MTVAHVVPKRLLVVRELKSKVGVSSEPCTELIPSFFGSEIWAILVVWAICHPRSEGISMVAEVTEDTTRDFGQHKAGRQQMPPCAGHGNPQPGGQPLSYYSTFCFDVPLLEIAERRCQSSITYAEPSISLGKGIVGSVSQEGPTRVSYKSFRQGSPTKVSYKHVPQECSARVPQRRESYKSVPQECPNSSILRERPTREFRKSVPRECSSKGSDKSVLQEFTTRESHKSVIQACSARVFH